MRTMLVVVLLALSTSAGASGLYKCKSEQGAVQYQDRPCAVGVQSKPMLTDSTMSFAPYRLRDAQDKLETAQANLLDLRRQEVQAQVDLDRAKAKAKLDYDLLMARVSRPIVAPIFLLPPPIVIR